MKYTATTLSILLLFSSISISQVAASATAMGTFYVASSMTVTRLADLMFGDLIVSVNSSVLPTSAQAAQFLIKGNANSVVQVTITFPKSLTCGSNKLAFDPFVPIFNIRPSAASAVQFAGSSGGPASTGTDGNLYIWAGGRVMAVKNQPAGSYSGIIQLVVTHP